MLRIVVVLPAPLRPIKHRHGVPPRAEGHALEDVVLADIGMEALDLEHDLAHASGRRPPK